MRFRIIFLALMILLACSKAVDTALAEEKIDYLGENVAVVNLNVRSSPTVPIETAVSDPAADGEPAPENNLIGHYLQGEKVIVTAVIGNWCKVSYKSFSSAFVYCEYLSGTGTVTQSEAGDGGFVSGGEPSGDSPTGESVTPTAVTENEPPVSIPEMRFLTASDLLYSLNHWLFTEREGINYLNDSYWQAMTKSMTWSADAKMARFDFEYPPLRDQKCTMVFSGKRMRRHIFKTWCYNSNYDEIETVNLRSRTIPAGFDPASMIFSSFIFELMRDDVVMNALHEKLDDGSEIRAYFRLYDRDGKGPVWEARFVNTVSGTTATVWTGANESEPVFILE
jgi:hypothetical protein